MVHNHLGRRRRTPLKAHHHPETNTPTLVVATSHPQFGLRETQESNPCLLRCQSAPPFRLTSRTPNRGSNKTLQVAQCSPNLRLENTVPSANYGCNPYSPLTDAQRKLHSDKPPARQYFFARHLNYLPDLVSGQVSSACDFGQLSFLPMAGREVGARSLAQGCGPSPHHYYYFNLYALLL